MSLRPLLDDVQKQPDQPAHREGWTLEAENANVSPVGVQGSAIRLRRDEPAPHEPRELARTIAGRATYLLEPLAVIESDGEKALVRSQESSSVPERDYYELWVAPDSLSVERYRGHADQPREKRPLSLTWEQAERLLRDVEAAYEKGD